MNSITQDMKYRQSLLTYAQKYGVRVSNIGYTQSAARKSREGWRFAKQIRPDLD